MISQDKDSFSKEYLIIGSWFSFPISVYSVTIIVYMKMFKIRLKFPIIKIQRLYFHLQAI